MATNRPPPGLLSKVANFFRESTAQEEDAVDSPQVPQEEAIDQAKELKNLMQRKRRDDGVRRREFNQLRKLRRARLGNVIDTEMPARPSLFQTSSGFGLEDRESTIKKINVIEAHMVQSWANAKLGRTAPKPETTVVPSPPPAQSDSDMDLDFTGMLAERTEDEPAPTNASGARPTAQVPPPSAVEVGLQEASLRFAEGDSRGAEVLLLGLFQDNALDSLDADVLASALCDVYRATGQHEGFDAVALEYAKRFGRSPGEWFSVPELLDEHVAGDGGSGADARELSVEWVSPAVLGVQALAGLRQRFANVQEHWHIDWGTLQKVDVLALLPLTELFAYWFQSPVELHWIGSDALLQALELHAPPAVRSADPRWWLLRMDLLCLLGRHEAFEELALDYCVVYEVSPPSWRDARCTLVDDGQMVVSGETTVATTALSVGASVPRSTQDRRCDLAGELVGDAGLALSRLRLAAEGATDVTVSCALLLRVDRVAIDNLVVWSARCASRGCHVRFTRVPCLVAILFQQVGLDQHAEIFVRVN